MSYNADNFWHDVFWCAQWVDSDVCEECGGTGDFMYMVCYGGPPIEKHEMCEYCEGNGLILAHPTNPLWYREFFEEVTI